MPKQYLVDIDSVDCEVFTKTLDVEGKFKFIMARHNEALILLTDLRKVAIYTQVTAKSISNGFNRNHAVVSHDIAKKIADIYPYAVIDEIVEKGNSYRFSNQDVPVETHFYVSEKEWVLEAIDRVEVGSPVVFTDWQKDKVYVMTNNAWFGNKLFQVTE